MVAIMSFLHQYVPTHAKCSEPTECTYKPSQEDQFYKILVGGDQLTAARARSSKKHMINANTPQVRLEGLVPMVEDWHSKACLLGVSCTVIYHRFMGSLAQNSSYFSLLLALFIC